VGKHFLGKSEFLVLFSLAFVAFVITSIWWWRVILTKLKFERRVET
jgi:hypothetical protein